ncbi:hypothetical protein MLD38_013012 [Melastoma candidum]|uniref:Uncharacterized protein n=1 Tax=Melastoma candidum TaxID=119954 RepID=A0ACB9R7U3_9MYRT|nr:hypothetical protein MLD38_013012 [Melastoma candidum]
MRRRDAIAKGGAPSADLLVCFPHRAHLTVMPTKAICSPTRHLEQPRATPAAQPQPVAFPHHRRSKSSSNGKVPQSPVLWVKTKHMAAAVASEPTSPKVTCVGQIKVQTKKGSGASPCKGWQSVMHEIEWIHKDGKRKKRTTMWGEALGFNKDAMKFLTCLRSLKFNFRCFGNFPGAVITSDDDDEEEDDDEDEDDVSRETDIGNQNNGGGNGDVDPKKFSKWYMVLKEDTKENRDSNREKEAPVPSVPPPNALLLMRCRSAPAKSWLVDTADTQCADDIGNKAGTMRKNLKIQIEEEKVEKEVRKMEEGSVTASYDADYYRISSDVAQETWIVGGFRDVLSKSRSWKI